MDNFNGLVRGLSSEGLGIVNHPDGRVFFVSGTWPGDEGIFKILRFEKRYGFAELHELKTPSVDRVKSPCVYQGVGEGRCGGCPWMLASYESQLKHKEYRLKHALDRGELLKPETKFLPIAGSVKNLGYRNRAQFKTDGKLLGFVADSSHEIVDIEKCEVLNTKMQALHTTLREKIPNPQWQPMGKNHWNFLDVDDESLPNDVALNSRRPFKQGNTEQNEFMREWVRQRIATMNKEGRVLELYSGSGNFTSVFVENGFQEIIAIEVSQDSIAKLNAKGWNSVQTFTVDLSHPQHLVKLADRNRSAQHLFLDPPREGAKSIERLVEKLTALKSIIYVSCDVATFVRDASALKARGFFIQEIQAVDLYPHTSHVEILALLTKF